MKKFLATTLAALSLIAGQANAAEYPTKDIQGVIMWGAGGSTDTVMRSVTPHVEKLLGADVIMTNKTGGVGAIATKYVFTRKADGYTLLMGAENPQMYKVLGLAPIDYSDMIPISILARGTPIMVASNDAPYNNMQELIDYVKANPGKVKAGSTGQGGMASIVMSMLQSQVKLDTTTIPYDGDGPALTALQGGAIDIMPAVLGAAIEHVKAGRMKVIGLIDVDANPLLPNVTPITETLPGLKSMLPWGPFFGVFVKAGTPANIVSKLSDAFNAGAQTDDFKALMAQRGYTVMGISGDTAKTFLESYRSVSSWLVYDAGFAKQSPDKFGIKRPQ
ncbi:Bug family tripartite tricarboxylate transporter substrate binding protein [Oceanobacter mangrovi]|uniref:Bug family tripartite tricarboxylate transporter substrate binding protein n=1 Tax=Oceanobacter mangrovi TaxID=2862510 RepID=UPI001C8D74ED|nr:tripartite tricarboxylate transporter substrate binding protein [Oceanobacter mangrovi]